LATEVLKASSTLISGSRNFSKKSPKLSDPSLSNLTGEVMISMK
jgi:hypothetical protein